MSLAMPRCNHAGCGLPDLGRGLVKAGEIIGAMTISGPPPVIVSFVQAVGATARDELVSNLLEAGLTSSVGWDLGDRGPGWGPIGVLAVISVGAEAAARIGAAARGARDWLRSQRRPMAWPSIYYVEVEDRHTLVTCRITTDDPDVAFDVLHQAIPALSGDTPIRWNGCEWDNEISAEKLVSAPAGRSPIRVLAVATEWFSAHGGVSTFNRQLCRALAEANAEVFCFVPKASAEERDNALAAGVMLIEPPKTPGGSEREVLMRKPELPGGGAPDMIIGHGWWSGSAAISQAEDHYQAAARFHFIHSVPDESAWLKPGDEDDAGERADRHTLTEWDLAHGADWVVPVGPRIYRRFLRDRAKYIGTPPPALPLDPGFDAVDLAARTPPDGEPLLVLLTGRLDDWENKGLDIAARAVAYAVRQRREYETEVELLVRGTPQEKCTEFRNAILGWAGLPSLAVTVRPYSSDAERLQDDLRRATLVLMPSRVEGFGLVGLEAIVAGTPVLVSGKSGLGRLLRDVLSVDQFARVVVNIQNDVQQDTQQWGNSISAVLRNPVAAFADADILRRVMAKNRTWAMAATSLLEALDLDPRE